MILLAEIATEAPKGFSNWLANSLFALGCIFAVIKIVKEFRGEPPVPPTPPNGELHHAITAIVKRVDGHGSDIERLHANLERHRADEDRVDSSHRKALYSKLDENIAGVYERMEENRKELSHEIAALRTENNTKMEQLPERILNMLDKINALRK